jgi:hypothetical protein
MYSIKTKNTKECKNILRILIINYFAQKYFALNNINPLIIQDSKFGTILALKYCVLTTGGI